MRSEIRYIWDAFGIPLVWFIVLFTGLFVWYRWFTDGTPQDILNLLSAEMAGMLLGSVLLLIFLIRYQKREEVASRARWQSWRRCDEQAPCERS